MYVARLSPGRYVSPQDENLCFSERSSYVGTCTCTDTYLAGIYSNGGYKIIKLFRKDNPLKDIIDLMSSENFGRLALREL